MCVIELNENKHMSHVRSYVLPLREEAGGTGHSTSVIARVEYLATSPVQGPGRPQQTTTDGPILLSVMTSHEVLLLVSGRPVGRILLSCLLAVVKLAVLVLPGSGGRIGRRYVR